MARFGSGPEDQDRRACARLLARFGRTDDPNTASQVVRACRLAPAAVADPARLVALAEMAVASAAGRSNYLSTLGSALYRARRYEEAIGRLDEAIQLQGRGGDVQDWPFLAMAHHHLGHADEARAWLDKARERVDQISRDEIRGIPTAEPTYWFVRLALQRLCQEAETLLSEGRPSR